MHRPAAVISPLAVFADCHKRRCFGRPRELSFSRPVARWLGRLPLRSVHRRVVVRRSKPPAQSRSASATPISSATGFVYPWNNSVRSMFESRSTRPGKLVKSIPQAELSTPGRPPTDPRPLPGFEFSLGSGFAAVPEQDSRPVVGPSVFQATGHAPIIADIWLLSGSPISTER